MDSMAGRHENGCRVFLASKARRRAACDGRGIRPTDAHRDRVAAIPYSATVAPRRVQPLRRRSRAARIGSIGSGSGESQATEGKRIECRRRRLASVLADAAVSLRDQPTVIVADRRANCPAATPPIAATTRNGARTVSDACADIHGVSSVSGTTGIGWRRSPTISCRTVATAVCSGIRRTIRVFATAVIRRRREPASERAARLHRRTDRPGEGRSNHWGLTGA